MDDDRENGEERSPTEVPYLIIRAGGLRMAIPANVVDQLYAPQQLTPLPLAPKHILGISNFGGVVIPLIDILRLLEAQSVAMIEHPKGQERVVVVSATGMTIGIVCDEARGLKHIRRDQFQEVTATEGEVSARVASRALDEEGELMVLKMSQLLEEARVKESVIDAHPKRREGRSGR